MISNTHPTIRFNLSPRSRDEITARRRSIVTAINHILDLALVAVVVATTLYLLDDSEHAAQSAAQARNARVQNTTHVQILPTDPRDAAVSSDLAAVRTFRDAIVAELTAADSRLHSGTSLPSDIRRRHAMEKILSNAGHTGLDDRIAQIEAAIRLRSSPTYIANRDHSSIKQAIQDLHDTAISCRSGALASAVAEMQNTS